MQNVVAFRPPKHVDQDGYSIEVSLDLIEAATSSTAKILYTILLSYCKHGNQCWPSQELLADRLNRTLITVRRNLRQLEQAGFITILPPELPGRLHNIYVLELQADRLVDRPRPAPATRAPAPGIINDPSDGSLMIHRPIINDPSDGSLMIDHDGSLMIPESESLNTCERDGDPWDRDSKLVEERDITQTSNQGYVALLSGIAGKQAAAVASRIAPNRGTDYVQGWIEIAATKNIPVAYLKTVFTENSDLPVKVARPGPPGATRNREKASKGVKGWQLPELPKCACGAVTWKDNTMCLDCEEQRSK